MSYSAGDPIGGPDESENLPTAAAPPTLADMIDPQNGDFLSIFEGRDPVDAQVIEALMRVRGSGAAVQDVGQRYMDIEKVDENAPTLIDSETRLCLRALIERGDIEFVSVTPLTYPEYNAAEVEIVYVNKRSSDPKPRRQRVRLPEN